MNNWISNKFKKDLINTFIYTNKKTINNNDNLFINKPKNINYKNNSKNKLFADWFNKINMKRQNPKIGKKYIKTCIFFKNSERF